MQVADSHDGPRLLLVEDDPGQAFVMQEHLRLMTVRTSAARSCAQAVQHLRRRHFDLVILDVDLPDGTAFDIQDDLRNRSDSTPVVFVTADADAETAVRALESGASGYIVKKPGFATKLTDRVSVLLERNTGAAASESCARELAGRATTLVHHFGKELFWISTHARRLEAALASQRSRGRATAIRQASEDMARAARSFLEHSAGRRQSTEKTGLVTAIERAVTIASRLHGEDRIHCEQGAGTLPVVSTQIVDVLVCLLDNALRASPENGSVRVFFDAQGFRVSDEGTGMSAELLETCCERGVTTRAQQGGHGVGLAVAKQIVRASGGSLKISSQIGAGTTVGVQFARERQAE